jgi:hypothetical protein
MTFKALLAAVALSVAATAAHAQVPPLNFDQAAYITCREAHAMQPEARKQLAVFLAQHAASHRGIVVPDDERGAQLALLVRGGCTLAPEAYLFTVIDRALQAEALKLPKSR